MQHNINYRPLSFDTKYKKTNLYIDPITELHLDIIALYIPHVEKFIIQSVNKFKHNIDDASLKQQVSSFLKQESAHRKQHLIYFKQQIQSKYPKLLNNPIELGIALLIAKLASPKLKLSITAAGEHFTAILSDYYLSQSNLLAPLPSQVKQLWQWHFYEEIEHKAVVFDMLKYLKIGYWQRMLGYILVSIIYACSIRPLLHMLIYKKYYKQKRFYQQIAKYFKQNIKQLLKFSINYLAYFKPSFHPWQDDNSELLASQQWFDNKN